MTFQGKELRQLQKALNIEPLLAELENTFKDPIAPSLSRLGHGSQDTNLPEDYCVSSPSVLTSSFNFAFMPKERQWLRDVLESSSEDETDARDDERVEFLLKLHCRCLKWRKEYHRRPAELQGFKYYSAGLFLDKDPYEQNRPRYLDNEGVVAGKDQKKGIKRKAPGERVPRAKKGNNRLKKKQEEEEDWFPQGEEPKPQQPPSEDVNTKRNNLWQFIAKKDIPKAARTMNSARQGTLNNAKKVAAMCQREIKRNAMRSWKLSKDSQSRAKRMVREVLVYWKKYERVEKEQRKKAEKEAEEQRRLDEEMREARRQQRKLNFLITQTELYAHFIAKKLTKDKDLSEEILKKLEDTPLQREVMPGVVVDLEHPDEYDSDAMKAKALANVESAFRNQNEKLQVYNACVSKDEEQKDLQESFDRNFSLANPSLGGAPEHPQPKLFQGELKGYQLKGMNWLANLYNQGINGILADEMGLGKTIQSIALLAHLAEMQGIWGPFLVVTPASTLHNWQQECSRFTPQFTVMPYWGNPQERKTIRKFWNQKLLSSVNSPFHILITSYQLVVADAKYFQRVKWQYLILDEAQAIKSSNSLRWKVLLSFNSRNRLLLTGTPIQNSMAELWALLHFIMPTLFDSHDEFNEWFSKDIESHAEKKSTLDENQLSRLHMILKPFMLRRIKKDVEHEMAPKVEVELSCPLTPLQQRIYQRLRNKITVEELLQNSTVAGDTTRTSSLMNLVMQFRKVCNHVELFERREARSPLLFTLPAYCMPKLIYKEGLLAKTATSRWKLLTVVFGLFSTDHLHRGFYEELGALRLAGYSPSEVNTLATGDVILRLRLVMEALKRVAIAYKQWVWSSPVTHPPLQLWPLMVLSPSSIQDSSVLSSLMLVTSGPPSFTAYSYTSHDSHVAFNDDEPVPMCNGSISPTSSISSNSTGIEDKVCRTKETSFTEAIEPSVIPLPSFVTVSIEQVIGMYGGVWCSTRAAQVEQDEIRTGGSYQLRNFFRFGAESSDLEREGNSGQFCPTPPGGLEAVYPPCGWSRITLPNKTHIITDSGKLLVLDKLLARLKREGHRVLIYSQMTKMIDILEDYMQFRQYKYTRLDGSSRISDRRDMVEDFQTRADIFVFLLSTRAGGLGINLTAADTVIFYDSDWNPTVDQQAMDRAHRLGQTRQVTVYRLIVKGTIEERILQRAKEKSEIHRMVIQGGEFKSDTLKPKEVVSLLLDDAEVETKLLAKKMERKQIEEQRKSRKRPRTAFDDSNSKRSTPPSRQSPEQFSGSRRGKTKRGRGGLNSAAAAGAAAGKLAASNAALNFYFVSK